MEKFSGLRICSEMEPPHFRGLSIWGFFFFPSYFGLKFYQLLPLPPPFSPVQLL